MHCKKLQDYRAEEADLVMGGIMNCRLMLVSFEGDLLRALQEIRNIHAGAPASPRFHLFAFRQAVNCWKDLLDVKNEESSTLSEWEMKERLIFIMAATGLGLSQLLGQISPSRSRPILSSHKLNDEMTSERDPLEKLFDEFLETYCASVDFGRPQSEILDGLSEERCKMFLNLAIKIGHSIIRIYNEKNEYDEELDMLKTMMNQAMGYC